MESTHREGNVHALAAEDFTKILGEFLVKREASSPQAPAVMKVVAPPVQAPQPGWSPLRSDVAVTGSGLDGPTISAERAIRLLNNPTWKGPTQVTLGWKDSQGKVCQAPLSLHSLDRHEPAVGPEVRLGGTFEEWRSRLPGDIWIGKDFLGKPCIPRETFQQLLVGMEMPAAWLPVHSEPIATYSPPGSEVRLGWRDSSGTQTLEPLHVVAPVGPRTNRIFLQASAQDLAARLPEGVVPQGHGKSICSLSPEEFDNLAVECRRPSRPTSSEPPEALVPVDWKGLVKAQNDLPDAAFGQLLQSAVDEVTPALKQGIEILARRGEEQARRGFQGKEDILKGTYCGVTSDFLGYLLEKKGFSVQTMERHDLRPFRTDDHALLAVTNPQSGAKFVVDPTFYQFADQFSLEKAEMPREDVLIFRADQKEEVARRFAGLVDRQEALQPQASDAGQLAQRKSEWTTRFLPVWDLDGYKPRENHFADKVEAFRSGDQGLNLGRQELIGHFGFHLS